MELWIRSQDKEILVLAKGFETQHTNYDGGCQIFAVWQNNYQMVGKYKNKERALEVLDEIQNILQPRLIVHQPNIDYDDMIHSLTEDICLRTTQKVDMELKQAGQVVYQMPKE